MKTLVLFMTVFWVCVSCFSQERIHEQVSVKWWVVPMFAVDRDGNPVTDLKKEDLQFKVNQHTTTEFTLIQRVFNVNEKSVQNQASPVLEKKKLIFFLFDVAFSSLENLKKSLEIARSIVENSSAHTEFSLFTIDPYIGLVYLGGPLEQKVEVLDLIKKKVVLYPKARSIEKAKETGELSQVDSPKESLYSAGEIAFFEEVRGQAALRIINKNYFFSLTAFAYAMNSFPDNKFAYFFSEGLPRYSRMNSIFRVIRNVDPESQQYIRQSAEYLGRSGAVLFIINPVSVGEPALDEKSGEGSLQELAEESGGKYFEGEKQSIANRIQNMHRAYYEIAFPDRGDERETTREISVTSKRQGISINTIRSLEKSKPYAELNDFEKEIFVLNLINRNPFYLKKMALPDLIIKKHYRKGEKEVYEIVIPDGWTRQELDLYKARIDQVSGNAEIEKRLLLADTVEQTIEIDDPEKRTASFVIINPKAQAALLPKPETEKKDAPVVEKITEIKAMAEEFKYNAELAELLAGAAGYCDKLKQAGFHYFCSEKVAETINGFDQDPEDDIGNFSDRASEENMLVRSQRSSRGKISLVSKFTFDYQLIKKENEVQEQRKLISVKKKHENEENALATLRAFLTEKAVFAPVTLFARERQPLYEYRFIAYENIKGVRCAVIEVLPRSQEDARYVYGQAWIDTVDHSVLKIKANPRSIVGYEKLQAIARQLTAKLFLNLEISFNQTHAGMRFPDRVVLSELYKGGRFILMNRSGQTSYLRMGSEGWERNHTEYTYKDYRFFEVGVYTTEKVQ